MMSSGLTPGRFPRGSVLAAHGWITLASAKEEAAMQPPLNATKVDQGAVDYGRLVEDRRVHGSLYTDAQVFEDEIDRIFRRGWVFVGHESEVPDVGDWVTRRLGREPVIMVRATDGKVHVLANRCAHRGTML